MSGLPGSGTSTAAEVLAEKTDMEVVSTGEVFRNMAEERDLSLEEFGTLAERNEEIDKELDSRLLSRASPGRILEGRLAGHLLHDSEKDAFKVWITANEETRVRRIAQREDEEVGETRRKVLRRERSERKRYMQYYGIDLLDKSIYDLVISSEENSPEEIVDTIMEAVKDGVR